MSNLGLRHQGAESDGNKTFRKYEEDHPMKQSEMVSQKDYWAKSACKMCIHSCAIKAHVVDGVVL